MRTARRANEAAHRGRPRVCCPHCALTWPRARTPHLGHVDGVDALRGCLICVKLRMVMDIARLNSPGLPPGWSGTIGCCAGARGTTIQTTCVPPTATVIPPPTGTTTSGFVAPGVLNRLAVHGRNEVPPKAGRDRRNMRVSYSKLRIAFLGWLVSRRIWICTLQARPVMRPIADDGAHRRRWGAGLVNACFCHQKQGPDQSGFKSCLRHRIPTSLQTAQPPTSLQTAQPRFQAPFTGRCFVDRTLHVRSGVDSDP